jgi:AcrR family transcriptional regulator
MSRPKTGQSPLTRDRIIEAALALVDTDGFDALTMRRLAATLKVDPMAIYHHIDGKEALLVEMARAIYAAMDMTPPTGSWREQVHVFAARYYAITQAHPALLIWLLSHSAAVEAASSLANRLLHAALGQSGLSDEQITLAGGVIVDYLNGYALGGGYVTGGYQQGLTLILDGIAARL